MLEAEILAEVGQAGGEQRQVDQLAEAGRRNVGGPGFGEEGADFIKGVTDLTAERCLEFNQKTPYPEGVFCQSYGSYMKKWSSAGFPLNFAYLVAALFSSSSNDGLVDIDSMKWGDSFTCIKPKSSRGISHGDVIDLFREDFSGFDVR